MAYYKERKVNIMQDSLLRRTEQFLENRRRVERAFRFGSPLSYCLSALLLGLNDCDADLDALVNAKRTLKRETGVFSPFRGLGKVPICTKLAVSDDPVLRLTHMKEAQAALKHSGFLPTDYICLAAALMAKRQGEFDSIAKEAHRHYKGMRHIHRILTSDEDASFAVLMAMYPGSRDLIEKAEDAFSLLKSHYGSTNSTQMTSHILALADADTDKLVLSTIWLNNTLKESGVKEHERADLPLLASLACMDCASHETVQAILDVEGYLSGHKCFSTMKLGRGQRLRMATALVAIDASFRCQEMPRYAAIRDGLQSAIIVTIVMSIILNASASSV